MSQPRALRVEAAVVVHAPYIATVGNDGQLGDGHDDEKEAAHQREGP